MKSPDHTEMDRLLRRHARLSGEAVRATRDAGSSAHLDADELNSYAEGVLPEAERSRYFAHLADCDTCRKLVTKLTLVASVANEGKARVAEAEAAPSKSWRKWLAAIFSPPVLRYAVPAMALFAIIIVAIVAMRSQREAASVAQRNEGAKYSAPTTATDTNRATEPATATNHASSNAAPLVEQQGQAQPGVAAAPPLAKTVPMEEDAPPIPQATPTKPAVAPTDDSKGVSREAKQAGERAQEEVAAAPPAAQPVLSAPAATEPSNREKRDEQKKTEAGKDDADEAAASGITVDGAVTDKTEANEQRNDAGRTTTTARSVQNLPRRRPSAGAKSGAADMTAEKERSAETRSIGGRRFRRQGSAWVDTAYNSSRPTTNVPRGSEQYRALIADEPGLRSIAEQLGGEVIVVWKSRAYRFH